MGTAAARVPIVAWGRLVGRGCEAGDHDAAAVRALMEVRESTITCTRGVGSGTSWLRTNDLTHAYVDENMGTS